MSRLQKQSTHTLGRGFEQLEQRQLYAADLALSAYINGSTLIVDGSDYDDTVTLSNSGSYLRADLTMRSGGVTLSQQTAYFEQSTFQYLSVLGKGGNDSLNASSLNRSVTMFGGEGNDYLHGSYTGDYLQGDNGNDFISANYGNDTIFGNAGDDTIHGWYGIDSIYAGTGNDQVYGGNDNDKIFGELGNDSLYGDLGDDYLSGGDGNDYMQGDNTSYFTFGGGNDLLYGGNGTDSLIGNFGNDRLYGENGNDSLIGGFGNDSLYGGNDNDWLWGQEGNDYLDGGWWNGDVLYGGSGADKFIVHKSVFGPGEVDEYRDYNTAEGDSKETDWHW